MSNKKVSATTKEASEESQASPLVQRGDSIGLDPGSNTCGLACSLSGSYRVKPGMVVDVLPVSLLST